MFGREIRTRRIVILALRIVGYVAFVYLTTYFLMMEPRLQAWDPQTGQASYESCYRFPSRELFGATPTRFTMIVPTSSCVNRLFWPADCLLHPVLDPYHRYMLDRYKQQKEGS